MDKVPKAKRRQRANAVSGSSLTVRRTSGSMANDLALVVRRLEDCSQARDERARLLNAHCSVLVTMDQNRRWVATCWMRHGRDFAQPSENPPSSREYSKAMRSAERSCPSTTRPQPSL